MSVFVIGDLHLSIGSDKPMDIFRGWENHVERISDAWQANVKEDDTVVIAGDISWALKLEQTLEDFRFIDNLPGKKLLMKGNHDYWWTTATKMKKFFTANSLDSLQILHNVGIETEDMILCGSRGWIFENGESADKVIIAREAGRIEASLAHISSDKEKVLFLHYPPIFGAMAIEEYFDIMNKYNVRRCYYGHLHGGSCRNAFTGVYRDVKLELISADKLDFNPLLIEPCK